MYASLFDKVVKELKRVTADNLYHNVEHMVQTYQRCIQHPDYETLSPLMKETLEVAALCHDAGYSLNSTEKENLESANNFVMTSKSLNTHEVTIDVFGYVCDLISSTDNTKLGQKFEHSVGELVLASNILRDCDMIQTLDVEWAKKLAYEQRDFYHPDNTKLFFTYHPPFTEYAQKLVKEKLGIGKFKYNSLDEYNMLRDINLAKARVNKFAHKNWSSSEFAYATTALKNLVDTAINLGYLTNKS